MPWAIFNRPSIQLGCLKSYLQAHEEEIIVDTLHPYLEAAAVIGFDRYRILSENSWAAESLYCSILFPEQRPAAQKVFSSNLDRAAARELPPFDILADRLDCQLDRWLDGHDFSSCSLAGFSICFSQLPASLLAAERLKERYPDLPVVFGGSICTPALANPLLNVFPQVDFVIAGEGEQALLSLCRFIDGRAEWPEGRIFRREPDGPRHAEAEMSRPLQSIQTDTDALPFPDYADYFNELSIGGYNFIPALPVEFSRGCWWNKCAFCNLNLQWSGYRHKKSGRMLREIEYLVERHQCLDFFFTDNSLPPAETAAFLTASESRQLDLRFFGEIRPLKKISDYALYARSGMRSIQVGIEALSDSLLDRMEKGVSVMDNIAAMKYCAEAGIELDGNLIIEFPQSTEKEVAQTLHALDFILPFRPLQAAAFFLGHGSPICSRPQEYGIKNVLDHPCNRQLYPREILGRLTMLIRYGKGDRAMQKKLWQPVRKKIEQWQKFHHQCRGNQLPLSYRMGGGFLIIRQERPGRQVLHHRLRGLSMNIYLACRQPVSRDSLLRQFPSITAAQLEKFLADLQEKFLLFESGGSLLALAVRQPNQV
jgi:ribosomal peptide maturation radical SAM protein 1